MWIVKNIIQVVVLNFKSLVTLTNNINFVLHYYNQNNLNYLRRSLYFTICEYNIIVSSIIELKSLTNNLCFKNQIMIKLYYQKKKIEVDLLSESLCILLQPRTVVYNIFYVSDRSPCVALTQFSVWWFHIILHIVMLILYCFDSFFTSAIPATTATLYLQWIYRDCRVV